MFCPKCGNKSPSGARFCQKCGVKFGNANETVNLLNHPASLAELGSDTAPYEATDAEFETTAMHTATAAKHMDNAGFMNYNVTPRRAAEIRPTGYKTRSYMAAPMPSAEMDYTFYPGQKAEPELEEATSKGVNGSDPMEYSLEPTFPKPMKLAPRVITDASAIRYHPQQHMPGLPAPQPHTADVAEFTGYQILPAAYSPAQQENPYVHYDRVQAQHVELNTEVTDPQSMFVQPVLVQPVPVQLVQPRPAPAPPMQPHPMPVPPVQQQPMPVHIPQPQTMPVYDQQTVPVKPQQPQSIPVQPIQPHPMPVQPVQQQPQPAPIQQPTEYINDSHEEMWQMYDEPDEMDAQIPRKKSKLPVIIGILVVLIIAGAGVYYFFNIMGNVNPSHLVGTWAQEPPLGTWIPRLEFRGDGTGLFYHYNTAQDSRRNETNFTWSIEDGNMMRNSLWPEIVEIELIGRARPPRFRRNEGGQWQSYVFVVDVD